MAAAAVVFLLATYLAYRNRRVAFYLFLCLLPFTHKEFFSLGMKDLLPARVVLVAMLVALVGQALKDRYVLGSDRRKVGPLRQLADLRSDLRKVQSRLRKDPLLTALLVLLAARILSLINSKNLAASLSLLLFYLAAVGLYILVKSLYQKHGWKWLEKAVLVYAGVAAASGLLVPVQMWLYRQGAKLFAVWPLENGNVRYGSFAWDVNHYAAYVVTAIPLLYVAMWVGNGVGPSAGWRIKVRPYISSLLQRRGRIGSDPQKGSDPMSSLGWGFLLLVASGALVVSLSRSGWLAGAVAFLILFAFLVIKKYWRLVWPLALAGFLGLVVGGFLVVTGRANLDARFASLLGVEYSDSTVAHVFLLKAGYEIFTTRPLIGVGFGSFNEALRESDLAAEYLKIDPIGLARIPVHSIWTEALAETGLVGSLAYLAMLGVVLVSLSKSFLCASRKISLYSLGLLASIGGLLVAGLFYSYNLEFFWLTLFLGYLVSLEGCKSWKKRDVPEYQRVAGMIADGVLSVGLFALAGVFILNRLGNNALIDWDESIYAEVARNILRTGDWITLYWKRGEPWFEKPPLYMWLTALVLRWDYYSDLVPRFWSALSGMAGVVLTYFLGKKLFNRRVGLLSALMLVSTVHWVWQGRNGTLDEMVSFWVALSLYLFWIAREKPKFWPLVGAALGLVVMTKGVVVVIPVAVMGLFGLIEVGLERSFKRYLRWELLLAIPALLLVAGPWHYLVWREHGERFIEHYFFYHVVERSRGIESHGEPFWWYNIVIRHWFRHWYALLLLALPVVVAALFKRGRKLLGVRDKPPLAEIFVLIWAGVVFFTFSFPESKIQWYILPIYPALVLINGRGVDLGVGVLWEWLQRLACLRRQGRSNLLAQRDKRSDLRPGLRPVVLWGLIFAATAISIPYTLTAKREMWFPEDLNYDLSESAEAMRYFSDNDDLLYTFHFPSGPALWYSDRRSREIGYEELRNILQSGERYFVLLPSGEWKKVQKDLRPMDQWDKPLTLHSEESALLVGHCDWPENPETGEPLITCREGTADPKYIKRRRRIYAE